ncbi:fmn-linked oxidoreductase [Stemphylium lycopersici]|uniref:tRNA-dihydrouridine(16/17) synthase [NAD(P)(+)] n=1 Tax=Stemphylium lycopersici TaxID=183478 RepID=A0A364NBC9_STELY|nr:fmn-linked oxidoreductase [Stemphylium lycopersici]
MATETTETMQEGGEGVVRNNGVVQENEKPRKLHGRAFYESIGSPKLVLAPMVEQSEFAWRLLSRSFLPQSEQKNLLAYTPMFHSKMFGEKPQYRDAHFQPLKSTVPSPVDDYHLSQLPGSSRHLDGNPAFDRPLTVQFCSNDPDDFLRAAKHVAPFCDAVDLNLGCPQGIAKRGKYGAFLQEDWDLISRMIRKLDEELDVPVTAKMRVLETPEKTLAYAKTLLDAGASIITVHGRRREQKGHNTGLADWQMIRHLRENLPKDTVIFANGNILQHEDIAACLEATGADGVMSAEGNLYDPTIFAAPPPVGQEGREYWRGRDGKGGYRVDAVMRRYMDIIHKYALGQEPPQRRPLWMPGDAEEPPVQVEPKAEEEDEEGPPKKKRKQMSKSEKKKEASNPNLTAMQAHLFHLLRPLVAEHHNVRDALARSRTGDIDAFENVLKLVEKAVKEGIEKYEQERANTTNEVPATEDPSTIPPAAPLDPYESSLATVARCKRPYWVCQPYVRPLPKEALEKGSMTVSKKEKKRLEQEAEQAAKKGDAEARDVGLKPGGRVEKEVLADAKGRAIARNVLLIISSDTMRHALSGRSPFAAKGSTCCREVTVVDKKSVKAREGLGSHPLRSTKQWQKLDPLVDVPPTNPVFRHVQSLQNRAITKSRREKLLGSVISASRRFSALVITDAEAAHDYDANRLNDVDNGIQDGRVVVYWVDGSLGGNGRSDGIMGAGLVWHTKQLECTRTYKGGRYTGGSSDAEILAIAAGLAHAKAAVEEGARYELVRVYSDSLSALSALRVDGHCALGPLIWKTTAVEVIYDLADWFKDRSIRLELLWVKGHCNSAGNKRADRIAHDAVMEQVNENTPIDHSKVGPQRRIKTYEDVPNMYKGLGGDWEDEWLTRANVGLAWSPSYQPRPIPIIIHGAESEDDIHTTTRPVTESLDQQIKAIEASLTKRRAQIHELKDHQPEDEEWILQVATKLQCLEEDQFEAEKELRRKIHRRSSFRRAMEDEEDMLYQQQKHATKDTTARQHVNNNNPYTSNQKPKNVAQPQIRRYTYNGN